MSEEIRPEDLPEDVRAWLANASESEVQAMLEEASNRAMAAVVLDDAEEGEE